MINSMPLYKAPLGFSLIDIATIYDESMGTYELLLYENNVGENICVRRSTDRILFVDTYSYRRKNKFMTFKRRPISHWFISGYSPKRLIVAPGTKLINLSEFLFTKKTFQEVCVPVIADLREEYFEALSQKRIWKARWVRIRGTGSFFRAIGLDRAFAFVSFFVKAWKNVN